MLRALARIDLGAIERNCARLAAVAGPAALCAVVKADGYGHGAVPAARAAQAGGATWLAVATAAEAAALRAAGVGGPLLVMGALSEPELRVALAAGADVVAWRERFVAALAGAAGGGPSGGGASEGGSSGGGASEHGWSRGGAPEGGSSGGGAPEGGRSGGGASRRLPVGVHVKLDTGMGRLGTRDAAEALAVARAVAAAPGLRLAGAMTHFATADDDPAFVAAQLERFVPWADEVRGIEPGVLVHAANSAAALTVPEARFDMVRCGIAIYGLDPFHRDPSDHGLTPALSLHSYVAEVKRTTPGESAGYGRRFVAEAPTWLGTLPIGYADGVRRALTNNADVLVDGRRVPLVGTVSMDNITVDLGDAPPAPGAPAVLIGEQGSERILAEEIAERLGTINYEVVTGISARVPREYPPTTRGDA